MDPTNPAFTRPSGSRASNQASLFAAFEEASAAEESRRAKGIQKMRGFEAAEAQRKARVL